MRSFLFPSVFVVAPRNIGAAIGGGLSAIGNIVGSNQTNATAVANQASAENYNTDMADTQYRRAVSDLDAAGLNPILAVGGQDAAPTISAAPVVQSLGPAMNAGVTNYSALQSSRQTDPTIDNTNANTNLQNAQAVQAAANTTSALSAAANNDAQTAKLKSGSLMSDVVGTDASSKLSSWLNSSMSSVSDAMKSVIDNITSNSGQAASRTYAPMGVPGVSPSP